VNLSRVGTYEADNIDPDSTVPRQCINCGAGGATLGVCRTSGPIFTGGPLCGRCGGGDAAVKLANDDAVAAGYPPYSVR
jgi:hypothetical protein